MRVLSAFQKCHSEIVMMQMRLMTLQFLGRYFIMELCLVPFPHPLGNLCTQEIIGEQHKRQRGFRMSSCISAVVTSAPTKSFNTYAIRPERTRLAIRFDGIASCSKVCLACRARVRASKWRPREKYNSAR